MLRVISILIAAAALAWFVATDRGELARFAGLVRTQDRQRRLRIWVARSFASFGLVTLFSLALIGELAALVSLPQPFRVLAADIDQPTPDVMPVVQLLAGMGASLLLGTLCAVLASRWLNRAPGAHDRARFNLPFPDITPFLPRNNAERGWCVLVAVNAGVSEELFFRLLVPLLLVDLGCGTVAAFAAAAIAFGSAHAYQGVVGVLLSTVFAVFFSFIYLATGSIWAAAAIHALIDIISLIIRPALIKYLAVR